MATISRRKLLSVAGAGVGAFFLPSGAAAELLPKEGRRIVVLGGGWGGATAARYAKLLAPEIEVVLIEAEDAFRSCPTSNWVIGGLWTMQDITIGYHRLQRNHGIKVIRDRATAIDPAAKDIRLTSGRLSYDRLILSPVST
jgi:sulfide dehydrogenase [flavocytochrome c] flavoprotein subunit